MSVILMTYITKMTNKFTLKYTFLSSVENEIFVYGSVNVMMMMKMMVFSQYITSANLILSFKKTYRMSYS